MAVRAAASGATATGQVYLCIDCGYIYDGRVPFVQLPKDYACPVCQAPKRRQAPCLACAHAHQHPHKVRSIAWHVV
jgi:rubredoxin